MGAVLAGAVIGSITPPGYVWQALTHLFTLGQPGAGRTYMHKPGDYITEAERAVHGWVEDVDVEAA